MWRRERSIADAVIADPDRHTTMDATGAVRSLQAAEVTLPEEELAAIWSPMHLERLGRTYWKYLSRVTLGLVRVVYTRTERVVVLIWRPLVLLRFQAPEYEMDRDHGVVRWRIRDGILVAQAGRDGDGYLEIDVRRLPVKEPGQARARVEIEVANFYPAIASGIARWVYAQTQLRIHVLITHGFLRSLARLELEESAVGRFAESGSDGGGPGARPLEEVKVGNTPWRAVGALAAGAGLAVALAVRARRRSRSRRRYPSL